MVGLGWGWLAGGLSLPVGGYVPLRPNPCRYPFGDASGDTVFAPIGRRLCEVEATALAIDQLPVTHNFYFRASWGMLRA